MSAPTPLKKSKVKAGPNHIYITERVHIFKTDVPTVDVLVEQAKLNRKLQEARELGKDPSASNPIGTA
ncbi:hypothetical protein ACHHYP_20311 [Achlya hypogyna]|uniref:Uncharacterized protein n=1 Tax=Achlya hypogyna TaxID=1202772 RepID=A0A1V9ZMX5_ACHHY|nr:hypothetical protein ACHHYP_20311 [Achlya hypogyna]